MSPKQLSTCCLLLTLLSGATLGARQPHTQRMRQAPSGTARGVQRPTARPLKPPVRPDNYFDLRAKYVERLEREKAERARRTLHKGVRYEDPFETEFGRWDWYWSRRLAAGPDVKPGTMADMSLALRQYHEASRRGDKATLAQQPTPKVCPSAGLGNWTSVGPSTYPVPVIGRVASVYISTTSQNTAYAGSGEGGLFKTVNNGASWVSLTDPSKYPALGITSIAVHPTIPTTLYISTNNGTPRGRYGFGVLKSLDGGTTWQEVFALAPYDDQANYGISDGSYASKVVLHPQDPNTVYVLASQYVFRSQDAGATWEKVLEIPEYTATNDGCRYRLVDIDIVAGASGVADSRVVVSSERTAYMGYANSPCGTAKTLISHAGGAANSFTEITAAVLGTDLADRIAAVVQPGNNSSVFFGYDELVTNNFVFKRYDIASNTSTLVGTVFNNGPGAGFWNLEMEFSKLNPSTLYVAGTTLYRISLAGGFSGAQVSNYWATDPFTCANSHQTHGDIRAMTVGTHGTFDVVVLGTDGGIHKAELAPAVAYTTATAPWDDISGPGLAINEVYDISGLESDPDVLVAGMQDNGTFKYKNGVWKQAFNYDGYQGTTNQATGEYFGATNADPTYAERNITGPAGGPGIFTAAGGPYILKGPIVSDPNSPATIYAGSGVTLYRSNSFGAGPWTALTSLPGANSINDVQVAPSDSNVVYVARQGATYNQSDISKRLYRSDDGGATWIDLGAATGANLWALAWASVSDIAVDPDDSHRVWVSFDGYWPASNNTIAGQQRVFYSGDGGVTWTNITANLLAFPVSSLVYRRGSDDELYAATDVGVFRYDKPTGRWECFNNQLPVVPVTKLEINYCKNKIRCATYGRGVYESDLAALPEDVVATSATWSGVRYLSNNLTVASGATLNITGTLYVSKGVLVTVRRGATLKVNGSKITNCCGDMWHGIEVWGTTSVAQNVAAAQGKLILQNGALIENAEEAVVTGRSVNGGLDPAYDGGIVQASNSTFSNNRRSVRLTPYHWTIGSIEPANISSFKNCAFETTRRLNDATLLPLAHVWLEDVKNVNLFGCKFRNTAAASVYGPGQRGDGVVSLDAQYSVNDLFNTFMWPPVMTAPSVFEGLDYGVRADFNAGVKKWVVVQNSDFNNVRRGVQVNNSFGSSVLGNNFTGVPNAQAAGVANATWGARMNGASALSVSGNNVAGVGAAYLESYGVIIDNCGNSASNAVRGNTLQNLYTGIAAVGNNGVGPGGVQFGCNVFQAAMDYQLYVQPSGTLANQGSACAHGGTADNTFFTQATPPGSQISALGVSPFDYYASGTVPSNIAGPVIVNVCGSVSHECDAVSTGTTGWLPYKDAHVSALVFGVLKVGALRVNFPADMAAGEVVSGTIIAEPEGEDGSRDANLRALGRFVIEIDGGKVSAAEKSFRLTLPMAQGVGLFTVRLLDDRGRELDSQEVPYLARPAKTTNEGSPRRLR